MWLDFARDDFLSKVLRGKLIREAAERHQAMTISISKLFLYPIKSCRGIPVSSAEITPLGFKYDRNYMLVEVKPPKADEPETWVPMTLRQHPRVSVLHNQIVSNQIADGFNQHFYGEW